MLRCSNGRRTLRAQLVKLQETYSAIQWFGMNYLTWCHRMQYTHTHAVKVNISWLLMNSSMDDVVWFMSIYDICETTMALRLGISPTSASVEIVMPRELPDSLALPYCSLSPSLQQGGSKPQHPFPYKMNSMNWHIMTYHDISTKTLPPDHLGSTIDYPGSCGWQWSKQRICRGERGKEGGCGGCLHCILHPQSQGCRGTVQAALLVSTALQPAGTADTSYNWYELVMQTFPVQFCPISIRLNFSTILNACTHKECMMELHPSYICALQTHRNSSV